MHVNAQMHMQKAFRYFPKLFIGGPSMFSGKRIKNYEKHLSSLVCGEVHKCQPNK